MCFQGHSSFLVNAATSVLALIALACPAQGQSSPVRSIPGQNGDMLFEGDIIVPADFLTREPPTLPTCGRTASYLMNLIPNVSEDQKHKMWEAMNEWESFANVHFLIHSNETNYVHIQDSSKNDSSVGMQGRQQFINISDWNVKSTMQHELAHALGLWHKQSRDDRNDYVDINWQNIRSGEEHNFCMATVQDPGHFCIPTPRPGGNYSP